MNIDKKYLKDYKCLVGCDEVGRGPIAGPVVACAVKFKSDSKNLVEALLDLNVTDSKKLSEKKRSVILEKLRINVRDLEVGKVYKKKYQDFSFKFCLMDHSPEDIDRINILQASLSAMRRASDALINRKSSQVKVLVDGNKVFESKGDVDFVIKGDSKVVAIGLASIIAKNFRDELMKDYDGLYPGYGLSKHAGYPTKEHKLAVTKLGPTPIHRRSFKGVKEHC